MFGRFSAEKFNRNSAETSAEIRPIIGRFSANVRPNFYRKSAEHRPKFGRTSCETLLKIMPKTGRNNICRKSKLFIKRAVLITISVEFRPHQICRTSAEISPKITEISPENQPNICRTSAEQSSENQPRTSENLPKIQRTFGFNS